MKTIKNKIFAVLLTILVAIPVIGALLGYRTAPAITATYAAGNSVGKYDACDMAQQFVSDRLKAPATASFASCGDSDTIISGSANHWTVMSYVDAQNGFGANIRNNYMVELQYHPDSDKWTLTNISMNSR